MEETQPQIHVTAFALQFGFECSCLLQDAQPADALDKQAEDKQAEDQQADEAMEEAQPQGST